LRGPNSETCTRRRRRAARTKRSVPDSSRASAESIPRGDQARAAAHVVWTFARRTVRDSPIALVARGHIPAVPHGALSPRRITALRQHRNGLLALALALRNRHLAGDHGDRVAFISRGTQ